MTERYNLDDLKAAVAKATEGVDRNPREVEAAIASAHQTLRNAARSGLLDDAALGRRVRAAAEGEMQACEWLANSIQKAWSANRSLPPFLMYASERADLAQAAASALVEMKGPSDE